MVFYKWSQIIVKTKQQTFLNRSDVQYQWSTKTQKGTLFLHRNVYTTWPTFEKTFKTGTGFKLDVEEDT